MPWGVAQGRGRWCQDCFRCWRTCFSGWRSQAALKCWIEETDDNRFQWIQTLTAYLSIAAEGGTQKIHRAAVEKRLAALHWSFSFLGLPFGPHTISKVTEEKGPIDASNLVQMTTHGVPHVGVAKLSPLNRRLSLTSMILKRPPGPTPRLPWAWVIQSASEDRLWGYPMGDVCVRWTFCNLGDKAGKPQSFV